MAALGGKREIMKLVADGTVSMAGTYSANGIAVAAANAALDELSESGKYEALAARWAKARLPPTSQKETSRRLPQVGRVSPLEC